MNRPSALMTAEVLSALASRLNGDFGISIRDSFPGPGEMPTEMSSFRWPATSRRYTWRRSKIVLFSSRRLVACDRNAAYEPSRDGVPVIRVVVEACSTISRPVAWSRKVSARETMSNASVAALSTKTALPAVQVRFRSRSGSCSRRRS